MPVFSEISIRLKKTTTGDKLTSLFVNRLLRSFFTFYIFIRIFLGNFICRNPSEIPSLQLHEHLEEVVSGMDKAMLSRSRWSTGTGYSLRAGTEWWKNYRGDYMYCPMCKHDIKRKERSRSYARMLKKYPLEDWKWEYFSPGRHQNHGKPLKKKLWKSVPLRASDFRLPLDGWVSVGKLTIFTDTIWDMVSFQNPIPEFMDVYPGGMDKLVNIKGTFRPPPVHLILSLLTSLPLAEQQCCHKRRVCPFSPHIHVLLNPQRRVFVSA